MVYFSQCGQKRCIVNLEVFSTCSEHVKVAIISSQNFMHVCLAWARAAHPQTCFHVRKVATLAF